MQGVFVVEQSVLEMRNVEYKTGVLVPENHEVHPRVPINNIFCDGWYYSGDIMASFAVLDFRF